MENVSNNNNEFVKKVAEQKYEFGFTTDVHTDIIDTGLNETTVRLISQKKGEPEWMLDFRLKAFRYLSGHILLCRPLGKEEGRGKEGD